MNSAPDIHWWLRFFKRLLLAAGLLLALVALGELARVYAVLRGFHPWIGWAFLAALGAFAVWLGLNTIRLLTVRQRALPDLPALEPLETASSTQLRTYRRALLRHTERLLASPELEPGELRVMQDSAGRLLEALPVGPSTEAAALAGGLRRFEDKLLRPLLERLDDCAEREIRRGTVEVMTAVTLSPWRSLDILMVLGRGLNMVLRISEIYGSRPTLREQLAILKDVAAAVAAVSLVGAGQKLIEGLASRIPLVGRVVDDLVQGVGAGFYINLAGWAARERCRSLQRWEPSRARIRLRRRLGRFVGDLRRSLSVDLAPAVWEGLTRRFRSEGAAADSALASGSSEEGARLREAFDAALADLSTSLDRESETETEENGKGEGRSVFSPLARLFRMGTDAGRRSIRLLGKVARRD